MIGIVNYGVGNLNSIKRMYDKLRIEAQIYSREEDLRKADKLILPGVGHFASVMGSLKASGLIPLLEELILEREVPTLGICVGMQILMAGSEEGDCEGLGWVKGKTIRFNREKVGSLRVPHVGFNRVELEDGALFRFVDRPAKYYFTHSYHVECEDEHNIIGRVNYGYEFACAISNRKNLYATQFHPEKSHQYGLMLMKSFAEAC